ncbi:hypothetical protein RDI58_000874 [Solanum bulbocastanum]|uniref:Uncharacterized protein n=1 Tax=Solanum bulbocastanum TaxID=147425 RepID=A0AAN8UAX8_SOLBU
MWQLQNVLTRAEKELKVWTSKKKKTISLIEDHQKKLSENHENHETITNHEDEIHAIEKIIPLSETKIKELAKLKEDAETSRHQILSHKLFRGVIETSFQSMPSAVGIFKPTL